MIIGFIGVPGCGKSTIARILHSVKKIDDTIIEYPLRDLYDKPFFVRNTIKFFKVLGYSLKNSAYVKRIRVRMKGTKKADTKGAIKVLINYIFFVQNYEKYKYSKNIVVFDEAFLYHLWYFQFQSESLSYDRHLECFFDEGLFSDIIISVSCNRDVLLKRLTARKAKTPLEREINDKRSIRLLEKQIQHILNYAKSHVKHRSTAFIEVDNTHPESMKQNALRIIEQIEDHMQIVENEYIVLV